MICFEAIYQGRTVAGDRVRLCRSTHHIHKVLAHWSCAVPEIKLIPPPLIEIVEKVIATKEIAPEARKHISLYSTTLNSLFVFDRETQASNQGASGSSRLQDEKISDMLAALLKQSLDLTKLILTPQNHLNTQFYESKSKPFDEMVRTGVWAPKHPVFRKLPYFHSDYLNNQANSRYKAKKDSEREECLAALRKLSNSLGTTCNKHKTKNIGL